MEDQPRKNTFRRTDSQSTPSISHSFVQQFAKASRSRSLSPKWDSTSRSSDMKSSISLEQFTGDTLAGEADSKPNTPDEFDTKFGMDASLLGGSFEFVSYQEVDAGQREEFETLLRKESGCARSCLHKGLLVNVLFFVVMITGIVLAEVFFPKQGVRGEDNLMINRTGCFNESPACFTVRIIRSVGVFGFLGGVTNWIAIEMLFTKIPLLVGTGIIAKRHKLIRESIRQLVVDTLFDPVALNQYFSGRKKSIREMLHLETHFGSLLNSDAANRIIDKKIDVALARPEGFVLVMMGADHRELKSLMKRHIQSFLADVSPAVLDRMAAPGITDGAGLQAEVERILEERVEDLSARKVKQLVAAMIRKHLSWLIVWGNLFGALLGLVAEIIVIVFSVTRK